MNCLNYYIFGQKPIRTNQDYERTEKIITEWKNTPKISQIAPHVKFCQKKLCMELDDRFPELSKINKKFNGLCDIICTQILLEDLLGKERDLYKKIELQTLNNEKVIKNHTLSRNSILKTALYCFFNIYCQDSFYSFAERQQLTRKYRPSDMKFLKQNPNIKFIIVEEVAFNRLCFLNEELFFKGLNLIKRKETVKLILFSNSFLSLGGHVLLIKKTKKGNYIYFDPDEGEYRGVSAQKVMDKVNEVLLNSNFSNIIFLRKEECL